jgi:hypothetical protein
MLVVHDVRPKWMTDDLYDHAASARSFDVDDPPSGWLLDVLREK